MGDQTNYTLVKGEKHMDRCVAISHEKTSNNNNNRKRKPTDPTIPSATDRPTDTIDHFFLLFYFRKIRWTKGTDHLYFPFFHAPTSVRPPSLSYSHSHSRPPSCSPLLQQIDGLERKKRWRSWQRSGRKSILQRVPYKAVGGSVLDRKMLNDKQKHRGTEERVDPGCFVFRSLVLDTIPRMGW